MANDLRRNTQVQNSVHELSHGSNPPKTRFNFLSWIPLAVSFMFFNNQAVCFSMWTISFAIALYTHAKNSEPKTETTTKITATYNLNRVQLLCILRNAQKEIK